MVTQKAEPPIPTDDPDAEGGGLPVDLRAIGLGMWLWRWWIAAVAVVALVAAVGVALAFAERVYTAETVMLYNAPPADAPEAANTPSLMTLLSMVKLASNLEAVREKLALPVDLRTLGSAVSVELQQKTTLVLIRVKWDDPKRAADIANAVREAFLENQTALRRRDAESRVRDIEARIAPVARQLAEAEAALRAFTTENRVVHLSEEARAILVELSSVNLLYEQAVVDKKSIDLQAENAQRLISELETQMKAEQQAAAALSDAMSETNIRIQRLRESIMDYRQSRADAALLELSRLNYERALKGYRDGIIPRADLERAEADFRVIEARAADTPEIEAWKREMAELDKKVIPSGNTGGGITGNLLKDIMFKAFEIKLQQTTMTEKVASLRAAKERVEERLARLPDLQRTHATLTRAVEVAEAESKLLEARLGEARRLLEASALPFTLVAEAKPPVRTSSSNTRKIAAAVFVLINGGFFAFCAACVVLDPRIRTRRELELRLKSIPVLAEIPVLPAGADLCPCIDDGSALVEEVRVMARRLRTLVPQPGARILLTAAGHDEGTTLVATNLARVLGRWGERVLLIDGQLRGDPQQPLEAMPAWLPRVLRGAATRGLKLAPGARRCSLQRLLADDAQATDGLGDLLLAGRSDLPAAAQRTTMAGVDCIPRAAAPASPDLLATEAFSSLMRSASAVYTVVLVDGPPALLSVDAENLSRHADAIVLVVRAMGPHTGAVREAVERLSRHAAPVVAAVVSHVEAPFAVNARRGG